MVFFSLGGYAQLNESDTAKWQLETKWQGLWQTGNVQLLRITGGLEGQVWLHKNWVVKTQNVYLYQRFFGQRVDDEWLSRNYLYFKPNQKFYPYAISYVSSNLRRRIEQRVFAGIGLTQKVFATSGFWMKVSTNLLFEQSRFSKSQFNNSEYDGSPQVDIWRQTLYLQGFHSFSERRVNIHYQAYWQQAYQDVQNYRWQVSLALEAKLSASLALSTKWQFAHEHLVVVNVRENDMLWLWGITYKRKSA